MCQRQFVECDGIVRKAWCAPRCCGALGVLATAWREIVRDAPVFVAPGGAVQSGPGNVEYTWEFVQPRTPQPFSGSFAMRFNRRHLAGISLCLACLVAGSGAAHRSAAGEKK